MREQVSSGKLQRRPGPRVQMFMWLLVQGRIQSRTVLHRKNIVPDNVCEVYNDTYETPEHIVFGYTIARQLWLKLGFVLPQSQTVRDLHKLHRPANIPQDEFSTFIAILCWQIWKARNAVVYRSERATVRQLLRECKSTAELWRQRLK
jgi:hypothetical protein